MISYLFDCTGTIPEGLGFSRFSAGHLLWLAAIAAVIAICCRRYRTLDAPGQHRFRAAVAALLLADELMKVVVLVATGQYTCEYLPLHLCSINIFTSLWYTLRPNRAAGSILYYLSLPGAAIALLSPTWVSLPFLNLMNIHSFSVHGLLMLYPLLLLTSGQLRPGPRELRAPTCFMLCAAPVLYCLNTSLGTNFMFLNGDEDNPILKAIDAAIGTRYHILGMAAIMVVVWTAMTLPWMARQRQRVR